METINQYKIEEEQHGRAGWVYYVAGTRLPFPWEILGTGGISISVPSAEKWDEYCDNHNANWAKGRREEILMRVAEKMVKKRYGNGHFEIEPNWIVILPSPSLLSRLLTYLK
jgi:hypothetical protein